MRPGDGSTRKAERGTSRCFLHASPNRILMNEAELVKKALAGDEAAKDRLFVRFEAMAYKLARPYVRSFGEDAISIGFLALWEGVMKFDPSKGMLSTVVYTQIRTRLLEEKRRRAPYTRDGVAKITEIPIQEWDSYEIGIDDSLHAKDVFDKLAVKLNAQERSMIPFLLDGEFVAEWSRRQGLSFSRGKQVVKSIRDKARPLLAA